MPDLSASVGPVKVLIMSWERPLYLWASLDSLYRNTKSNVDFILIDNNSRDPLVAKVISGFNRRGMFSEVINSPTNDPGIIEKQIQRLQPVLGRYFAFVESDVIIERGENCWVKTMVDIMESRPRLAMLGSQVDKTDFIDLERAVTQIGRQLDEQFTNLLKARSPERASCVDPGMLDEPHNPAGRLLMLRNDALREVGFAADGALYRKLKDKGFEALVTGDVIHRHLSLLNFFDYPDYDMAARRQFMEKMSVPW
jgi:glycosyltransferase involved in cell wall biosynthesis